MLEHNVSVEAITKYKLAALADAELLAGLVRDALPELSHDDAWRYTVGAWLMTSALWAYARPPEAVLQACAADKRLEKTCLDFRATLEDHLTTQAIGLHARAAS
jgi:Tetracyclin repressor-like, C-terminal domain